MMCVCVYVLIPNVHITVFIFPYLIFIFLLTLYMLVQMCGSSRRLSPRMGSSAEQLLYCIKIALVNVEI